MFPVLKIERDAFRKVVAADYITDTVFMLPDGELFRIATGRGSRACQWFKRMTKKTSVGLVLKAGEARYTPTESCKVTSRGLQFDGVTNTKVFGAPEESKS